jgi:hypothetical protein
MSLPLPRHPPFGMTPFPRSIGAKPAKTSENNEASPQKYARHSALFRRKSTIFDHNSALTVEVLDSPPQFTVTRRLSALSGELASEFTTSPAVISVHLPSDHPMRGRAANCIVRERLRATRAKGVPDRRPEGESAASQRRLAGRWCASTQSRTHDAPRRPPRNSFRPQSNAQHDCRPPNGRPSEPSPPAYQSPSAAKPAGRLDASGDVTDACISIRNAGRFVLSAQRRRRFWRRY